MTAETVAALAGCVFVDLDRCPPCDEEQMAWCVAAVVLLEIENDG